ncbi:ribosome hibernation-promoting factor, HPF/YfiA family [Roseomonas xinghualingensis]|uniref:ribosome hibernation-promoting factor, HPF/YfiA family n=1 Tax=Roseomonas xinghualingensis TaxID=2986475 RepID=UPI0021F16C16|nr:ribosome-associated translation inhibitor RaiA [Roseomonas sp. SXEYE001]MCV4207992.1 ribosome-associated translation inhibitor RaiA [Roseomonas sp. SXEYE001]
MHITVAGKGVDTGEALKAHVTDGLSTVTRKYFDHALDAHVTFRKDRAFFACDINLRAGRGLNMRAEGHGPDAHRAFAEAAEHIGKRLRRYRRRVNEHARSLADERNAEPEMARDVVLREEAEPEEGSAVPDEMVDLRQNGAIVAETPTEISHLTVPEAVMRLDLSQALVLMFRNRTTGILNVVYRRADGHVGWIDPQPEALARQA